VNSSKKHGKLLGDSPDEITREQEAFQEAMQLETEGVFQE